MKKRAFQRTEVSGKMDLFRQAAGIPIPASGWINAIRTSLGMTLEQLANKLSVSKQNIQRLERSEQEKSITLKSLQDLADAMDMELVYGFVPKDGSLDALIERKASKLAYDIVHQASQHLVLEEQKAPDVTLEKSVEERKKEIINKMPKSLWD